MPPQEREGGGGPGWAFFAAWLAAAAVAAGWLLSGQTPHDYARLYGLTRDLLALAAGCGVVGGTAWATRAVWRRSGTRPHGDEHQGDGPPPADLTTHPEPGFEAPDRRRPAPASDAPDDGPADSGPPPTARGV